MRALSSGAALALEGRRDVVIHAYTREWRLKAAFVGRTVAEAARRHGLEGQEDAAARRELGEAMAAALVAVDCKEEERVIVHLAGEGRETYAEALPAVGEVRGYVRAAPERAEQAGRARLSRVQYGAAEAASSTVEGRAARGLLRAQGLAALLWEGGAVVMEQSAVRPLQLASREAFQVSHIPPLLFPACLTVPPGSARRFRGSAGGGAALCVRGAAGGAGGGAAPEPRLDRLLLPLRPAR